jgi:SAM-dependent methyltransferase
MGIDLSRRMIERARERSRAEGVTNAGFEQADAQVYPFEAQAFDLAISRFGAMFFGDPIAAFRNIGLALRPAGRLTLLAWQEIRKNAWQLAIRNALAVGRTLPEPPVGVPGPFGLADANVGRRILVEAGFEDIAFVEINEPICLGANADAAFAYVRTTGFTHGMLNGLDETVTARALDALRATLLAHDSDEGVLFDSSAWLIQARRP